MNLSWTQSHANSVFCATTTKVKIRKIFNLWFYKFCISDSNVIFDIINENGFEKRVHQCTSSACFSSPPLQPASLACLSGPSLQPTIPASRSSPPHQPPLHACLSGHSSLLLQPTSPACDSSPPLHSLYRLLLSQPATPTHNFHQQLLHSATPKLTRKLHIPGRNHVKRVCVRALTRNIGKDYD